MPLSAANFLASGDAFILSLVESSDSVCFNGRSVLLEVAVAVGWEEFAGAAFAPDFSAAT